MAVVSVEVPNHVQKSIWSHRVTFNELYSKMEEENWVDSDLEKPVEMKEFYNFLKKEL